MPAAAAGLGASRRGAFGASLALHAAIATLLLKPLAYTPPIRPAVPGALDIVWLDAAGEAAAEHASADAAPPSVAADAPPTLPAPSEMPPVPADLAPPPAPSPMLATLPPLLPPLLPPPVVAPPLAAPPPPLPPQPEQPTPTQVAETPPAPPLLAAAAPPTPAIDAPSRQAEETPPFPPPPAPAVAPRPARTHNAARTSPPRNAGAPATARHAAMGRAETAAVSTAAIAGTAAAPAAPPGPVLITAPRYRRPPTPPAYPPRALEFGLTGTVIVRARIRPDGTTEEARIWRSSGHALLDAAALAAVRRWDFEPASVDGRRVEAWVEVPVHFRLN